jgi:hypothetical protein
MSETPSTTIDSPTRARKDAFLEAYSKIGTVTGAAKEAGIDRTTHYLWMENDREYADEFKGAEQQFCDLVRETVRDRAIVGISQEVYNAKGDFVGHRVVYSDRLLELLAKAKCPEFREKHELTGPNGSPLKIEVVTGVPQPETT